MRPSLRIAYSSILGGLALLTSISGLSRILVYPPVPYLKFDPAEVFDVLALYIGGIWLAVYTASIHMFGLAVTGGDIIGPLMKYLAVISMLPGLALVNRVGRLMGVAIAIAMRVLVMTVANIIVLTLVAPGFLEVFTVYNSLFGIDLSGFELIIIALILTGVYNIIHTVFTVVLVEAVQMALLRYIGVIGGSRGRP